MRFIKYTVLLVGFITITSCKKNYNCYCSNSNGEYYAGEIEDTESNAKQRCKDLGNNSTTCNIK